MALAAVALVAVVASCGSSNDSAAPTQPRTRSGDRHSTGCSPGRSARPADENRGLAAHELGDGYGDALDDHRRVVRAACTAHDGVEVDTQGDAFFIAFARASDAAAAAVDAQRGLADGPVRVRMGLHTGEPRVTDEGYVGIDARRPGTNARADDLSERCSCEHSSEIDRPGSGVRSFPDTPRAQGSVPP